MKIIMFQNFIRENLERITNYDYLQEFLSGLAQNSFYVLCRDSLNIKIPRIGETIYWHGGYKFVIEDVVYKYGAGATDTDDVVFIFGHMV